MYRLEDIASDVDLEIKALAELFNEQSLMRPV